MAEKEKYKPQEKEENIGKNEETVNLNINTVFTLFLGAMFIMAAFQTMQLSELKQDVLAQKNAVEELKTVSFSAPTASAPAQTTQTIPDSLTNVPDMVGGC